MSFFSKLKAKLFRSSSKLDKEIDNLIEEKKEKSEELDPLPTNEKEKTSEIINEQNDNAIIIEKGPSGVDDNNKEKKKKSFFKKIIEPVKKLVKKRKIDDELLESLEDLLIAADLGANTAIKVSSKLSEKFSGKEVGTSEIKSLLSEVIEGILEPVAKPLVLSDLSPQVILIVGVNGSGKTTTIGKLADKYKKLSKNVMVAACDTYRAAAVEQLAIWGQRAGVPVVVGAERADPASLAFEAYERASKEGIDLLLIDTAGRLQNKKDLMAELDKIVRVLKKKNIDAPHHRLIVLDATTGQNAINQVSEFSRICDLTGIIMTKLDGTARGGVLVAIAEKFSLPVHFIGVGETIDDLQPFEPRDFANAITGASTESLT